MTQTNSVFNLLPAMSKANILKSFCYDMFTLAIYGYRTISILLPKEHGMDMASSVGDSVKVCVWEGGGGGGGGGGSLHDKEKQRIVEIWEFLFVCLFK